MIPSWSFSPLNIACLVLSVGCKSNLFTNTLYFFYYFNISKCSYTTSHHLSFMKLIVTII